MRTITTVAVALLAVGCTDRSFPPDQASTTRTTGLLNLPGPPVTGSRARDFAKLTPAQARRLAGGIQQFVVELDSFDWQEGSFVGWQCQSANDTSKTVWLLEGVSVEGAQVVVEGEVTVLEHKARGEFPGFTEVRLVGMPVEE